MSTTDRVRPATAADLTSLVEFNVALAFETEDLCLDDEVVARGVERVLGDPTRGRYLVCERDGRTVGCLLRTREWSDWRDGWHWWIQSVYTAPDARRSGVYRRLYEAVLEEARRRGDVLGVRLYVERENIIAQGVYEDLGMRRSSYLLYELRLPG